MIFEHEIPEGSRLYFAGTAKTKRLIESKASTLLSAAGFEEIVTPLFSYHQHQSVCEERELIRIGDVENHAMSLRADSTIDVVRILKKRLGTNTTHKKWFYIQPVYRFPSTEQYQVGAEIIDECDLAVVLNEATAIFSALKIEPLLQISNINIPRILSEILDLHLDDFRHVNIEKFLSLKLEWLTQLVYLEKIEQIEPLLEIVPDVIRDELLKIKKLCTGLQYPNFVIAPLYYAKMLYYDELFFRVIEKNEVYAMGGRYKDEETVSVGFAIYTDALVEALHH
ncbi:MAG: ATP phosphoribosyltransferase regulatory subunit [Sulfuricurvum sp.]|nr:ATP phosphoribosyltransferase regulatory subunit [Sulfuricurvum sp.]MDP3023065.1 ATP phosphoribosyltransferase regulatory subunit [Sulfuricurvum sp.]MDP3119174.1 ATP phosphoribosyltransferase regulatory subunit [Sulfuricurvum sp.]